MVREYIITFDDEEKDIHGSTPVIMKEELVRCKDCRYNAIQYGEPLGQCMIKNGWFPIKPDWFCADGKAEERDDKG